MSRTTIFLAAGWILNVTAHSVQAQVSIDESGRLKPPREGSTLPQAQTVIVESPKIPYIPPLQTRPPRQIPYYEEPAGLRFGRWILHPEETERLTYDDNVLGRPEGSKLSDVLVDHAPGLSLFYKNGRNFKFEASYAFGWHDYLDDTARDYLTQNAHVYAEWSNVGIHGLTVAFRDGYNQTGNTQVLEDEFKSFSRVQGNQTAVDVSYHSGRITVGSGYRFSITDYFGRGDSLGDYFQHDVPFVISYNLSRTLVPYLNYAFKAIRHIHNDARDFDTHSVALGVRTTVFRKFTFDASVGNNRSISFAPYDSNDGPALKVGLQYRHSARIQAYMNASRYYFAAERTGSSTVAEFEIGGDFRPLRNFSIDTSVLWRNESRQSGTEQITLTMQSTFNYRIKKYLEATAGYNRSERSGNQIRDVTINQGTVGIRFRF